MYQGKLLMGVFFIILLCVQDYRHFKRLRKISMELDYTGK